MVKDPSAFRDFTTLVGGVSHSSGFDPVMFIPGFGQTFAELPVDVKNANSHRGRAALAMVALMRERWL